MQRINSMCFYLEREALMQENWKIKLISVDDRHSLFTIAQLKNVKNL